MNIEEKFLKSFVSLASYVDFDSGENHTETATEQKLYNHEDWKSQKMRDLFLEHFEVISHRQNSDDGFSATVFRAKALVVRIFQLVEIVEAKSCLKFIVRPFDELRERERDCIVSARKDI